MLLFSIRCCSPVFGTNPIEFACIIMWAVRWERRGGPLLTISDHYHMFQSHFAMLGGHTIHPNCEWRSSHEFQFVGTCWIYHDLTISNPNLIRSNNQNSMTGCFTIFHRMGCTMMYPRWSRNPIQVRRRRRALALRVEEERSQHDSSSVYLGIFPKVLSFGMQFHVYYIYIL